MPKFLYILLLVNLANACQSEHSSGTANQDSGNEQDKDSLLHDANASQAEEETFRPSSYQRTPSTPERSGSAQLQANAVNDSLTNPADSEVNPGSGKGNTEAPSGELSVPSPKETVPQQVFTKWDALFADLDLFLKEAVYGGRVRYGDLAVAPVMLNDMVARIASADLEKAGTEQIKAFNINAYNVLVIQQVVEHYPIPSPMDIAGFFDRQTYLVAGKKTTLNDLEAGLRSDPRVHFALVCGALGCPKILDGAFMPGKLDQQLDAVTRSALNDPMFLRYQEGDQYAELSQIFNWYAVDFGGKDAIIAYINPFRSLPIPEETAINFYDYSWKLNKTP